MPGAQAAGPDVPQPFRAVPSIASEVSRRRMLCQLVEVPPREPSTSKCVPPMSMQWKDYGDFYTNGPYAPHVREGRAGGSAMLKLFDIGQPPGDWSDPSVPDLVIIQNRTRGMRAHCDLGGGRFRIRTPTGGFCVVAPDTATDIVVDDPHELLVCAVPAAHLVPLLADAGRSGELFDFGRLHSTIVQSASLEALMARMWEAAASPLPASRLAVDGAMLTLLSELLVVAERPLAPARGGLAPWQIRRCIEFLAEHAGENVGLERLAALVGLSPFHFSRAFKHSTGVPPHRYQLNLRIARAKALLESTDLPVTEIALEVGYESSQALARLFRREVGLSPSDYRRQHR